MKAIFEFHMIGKEKPVRVITDEERPLSWEYIKDEMTRNRHYDDRRAICLENNIIDLNRCEAVTYRTSDYEKNI